MRLSTSLLRSLKASTLVVIVHFGYCGGLLWIVWATGINIVSNYSSVFFSTTGLVGLRRRLESPRRSIRSALWTRRSRSAVATKDRRTRHNATILERLPPLGRV